MAVSEPVDPCGRERLWTEREVDGVQRMENEAE